MTATRDPKKMLAKVDKILDGDFYDYTAQNGYAYSGRGMFGSLSSVAIVTAYHPTTPFGKKLCGLGLSYDSLGFQSYIYYTRW